MPTTIRLSDALRERLAAAAEREGVTPHAYMLAALEEKAEQAELRAAFLTEAQRRLAQYEKDGKALPWDEVKQRWLERAAQPSKRRRA